MLKDHKIELSLCIYKKTLKQRIRYTMILNIILNSCIDLYQLKIWVVPLS